MSGILSSISGLRRLRRSFSNSLEIDGSSDIGLYDDTSFGGFPGFCSIMICATLNASGTCFSRRHALNRYVNMTTPFLDNSLSTAGEILSMPGAFFGLMFVSISSAISIGVNSLVGSLGRRLITGLISDWMSFGVDCCQVLGKQ